MSNKEMTTAQNEAWVIGQYLMAYKITKALDDGVSIDDVMKQCLWQIAESARNQGQMTLFFEAIGLRQSYMLETSEVEA
jgi:hypothetical protein